MNHSEITGTVLNWALGAAVLSNVLLLTDLLTMGAGGYTFYAPYSDLFARVVVLQFGALATWAAAVGLGALYARLGWRTVGERPWRTGALVVLLVPFGLVAGSFVAAAIRAPAV